MGPCPRMLRPRTATADVISVGALSAVKRGSAIFSPPGSDSLRSGLMFWRRCFFLLSTRDLQDAWADRREILHGGQY